MKQYLDLLQDVYQNGHDHEDRTGVGRRSVFGRELRFDLNEGFPLVTTRKIATKTMILETLWFLSGSNRTLDLVEQGVRIWESWTPSAEDAEAFIRKLDSQFTLSPSDRRRIRARVGTIGPMYGHAWRGRYASGAPDQLKRLIGELKTNPYHSRHCVTAWLPEYLPHTHLSPKENVLLGKAALAACHCFFQVFCTPPKNKEGKIRLSLKLDIRSNDLPIGNPYNVAQYALLLKILAQCANMEAYELIVSIGDAHIYKNQLEQVKIQLQRAPHALPQLHLNPDKTDIDSFVFEDFTLEGYTSHPVIQYPLAA